MAFPNFPPIKMHGTAGIVIGQKFEKKKLRLAEKNLQDRVNGLGFGQQK